VVLSPVADVRAALETVRLGAADYLVEPCEPALLAETIGRLCASVTGPAPVAEDPHMQELLGLALRVAQKSVTVLLCGASGTGKEVFARFIHEHSRHTAAPFVAVNCAAIPADMLEAVLFGYEKGAFTGAHRSHAGKFEQAQGGTLLLDEISEIDLRLQAKLLRVMQEREVERLCGQAPIPLDVRVVATTNRDLRAQVQAGSFREDLYYRLHVFPLHLPPLCERPADVLPLARLFVARHAFAGVVPELTPAAAERLCAYPWPGNVRELENAVQRALVLADGGLIEADDLMLDPPLAGDTASFPGPCAPRPAGMPEGSPAAPSAPFGEAMRRRECHVIIDTLRRLNGSRKATAERLGMSPRTLRYKLARMREDGLYVPRFRDARCAG